MFKNPQGETVLANALGVLTTHMDTKTVVAVLKSEVCIGNIRAVVLKKLDEKAGKSINNDLWKAVEWAKKRGVDLKNVPPFSTSTNNNPLSSRAKH